MGQQCRISDCSHSYGHDDLLSAAAELVLKASHHLTTHDVEDSDDQLNFGLDRGESDGIWLANELVAAMFVTDEFNTTNYLFVALALDDRNTLFTTPHLLCELANYGTLDARYVDAALTYYIETKQWVGSMSTFCAALISTSEAVSYRCATGNLTNIHWQF